MMAFAQLQSQQQIAKMQVTGAQKVATIQADNSYAIAELNQGGDGKTQQYQNPDGTISYGLNGGQQNTFQRPAKQTLAQTNIKKIQLETQQITSNIRNIDAKTKTEFQKLLTELQVTKLTGNNAKYRAKELEFFTYLNNKSYIAKEALGIFRASGTAGKWFNQLIQDWIKWSKDKTYEPENY